MLDPTAENCKQILRDIFHYFGEYTVHEAWNSVLAESYYDDPANSACDDPECDCGNHAGSKRIFTGE